MTLLGRLLYGVRAGAHRSPLAGPWFDAPGTIIVTSTAFTDGGPMPASSAGKGVGDNISPPLHWTGLPPEAKQVVLIIDDVDVPLPRPLLHTIVVIEPGVDGVAEGALRPGSAGMRFIPGGFGHLGYVTKIFLTAVAVALTAMPIAPAAQADENQYLNQVANKLSVVLTRNQALALGNTACQAVRSALGDGMTLGKARAQADQAVRYASQNMGLFLPEAQGMLLVDAAVDQLC